MASTAGRMQTLVCEAPGKIGLEWRPVPLRGEDQVLVRVRRAGICGTDYHIFSGLHPFLSYPRLIGHELSGTVEQAPEGSRLRPGQIVAIEPYLACGTCHACRQGKTNCCTRLAVLGVHVDGGMCEWLVMPEPYVHPVDGLSLDQAAMIEFIAIGAHAVRRAGALAGRQALVVGAGPIGIATALMARIAGAEVTLADLDLGRLRLAAALVEGAATIHVGPDPVPEPAKAGHDAGFETVFDATGNRSAMERGFSLVAHGGLYVLVGVIKDDITFSDSEFHKREMTLMASRNATQEDFTHVIDSIRRGLIPTDGLLTHRTTLADAPRNLAEWTLRKEGLIKALIDIA